MAAPSTMGSKSSLSEAVALLPPLHLYRRVLRVHRNKLDPEMRILGDLYVKAEFRAHREVENPVHIVRYYQGYCWIGGEVSEYVTNRDTRLSQMADRVLDGVAVLCAEVGRGCLDWG